MKNKRAIKYIYDANPFYVHWKKHFCPKCGKSAVCIDFIRQNTDKYICVGKCENEEEYFVRFKFTKREDGTFTVSRIIYEMNEENVNYYYSKKLKRETKAQLYSERLVEAI